jgi:hypothetical protein
MVVAAAELIGVPSDGRYYQVVVPGDDPPASLADASDSTAGWPLVPGLTLFDADTQGQLAAHLVARAALLNLVVKDDRTQRLVGGWLARTGLVQIVRGLRSALGAWYEIAGDVAPTNIVPTVRAFLETATPAEIQELSDRFSPTAMLPASTDAAQAEAQLLGGLVALHGAITHDVPLVEEATAFALELGLPWSWLPGELGLWFYYVVEALESGGEPHRVVIAASHFFAGPPALEVTFTPDPWETYEQTRARVRHEMKEAEQYYLEQLAALWPDRGRVPGKYRETIERDVTWWFQNRVQTPPVSIRALTQQTFGKADERRGEVRDGIARAEKFLAGF